MTARRAWVEVVCRPIDSWNGSYTRPDDRRAASYSASWQRTVDDLMAELAHLVARDAVLGINVLPYQIRVDGWPKANATVPPPVVLAFESPKAGPLRFQCDRWSNWKHNVRAIGLTLERLRLVDEGGVARSGEQYQGWSALPPATPLLGPDRPVTSIDEAVEVLHAAAPGEQWDHDVVDDVQAAFKAAARRHHPDAGGDPTEFRRLVAARDLLLERAS